MIDLKTLKQQVTADIKGLPRMTTPWPIILWRLLAKVRLGPVPKVNPALGPCWLWTNGLSAGGRYAAINIDGFTYYVHRVLYTKLVGPVPNGLELDHLCLIKRCCNPAHLEPVTKLVNMRRQWARRRKS